MRLLSKISTAEREKITRLACQLADSESARTSLKLEIITAKELATETKDLNVKLETDKLELHSSSKAHSLATKNLDKSKNKIVAIEEEKSELFSIQNDRILKYMRWALRWIGSETK